MKTVSLRLAEDLNRRLAVTARKQGTSRSDLIRTALDVYFASVGRGCLGSCLDLGGDLFGCVEGPADLSVNQRYLKGFGK